MAREIAHACTLARHAPKDLVLTVEQAVEAIRWWAKELCLDQWMIDFEFHSRGAMAGAQGRLCWNLERNRASIYLLEAGPGDPDMDPHDMEQSIVHELVHLSFSAMLDWIDEDVKMKMGAVDNMVCVESPTDRMAWVLVNMRRSNPEARVLSWD